MTRAAGRGGFTVVELLVSLAVLGIIGTAMTTLLARQQKVYGAASDVMEIRSQLTQGTTMLATDLRTLSTHGGDILAMRDSSIDFRAVVGSSVACVVSVASPGQIVLPPVTLNSGVPLTSWLSPPAAGDVVAVFDEGANVNASDDDRWREYAITSVTTATGSCPASTGFTVAADAGQTAYTLGFAGALSPTVLPGAPLRFLRRASYTLYQSATDPSKWYLGYCSPTCSAAAPVQPVAGPFAPYADPSTGGVSGMRLSYFDDAGNPTTDRTAVARISILLAGRTTGPISSGGFARKTFIDSLRVNVAIRNRS